MAIKSDWAQRSCLPAAVNCAGIQEVQGPELGDHGESMSFNNCGSQTLSRRRRSALTGIPMGTE